MELGISTFGDLRADPVTGRPANTHGRVLRLLELAKTADQAGLDVPALGEHHRNDYRLMVGSPQQIIDGILHHHELLGTDRFMAQIEVGGMPEGMVNESLELYATEVAPVIRRETAAVKEPA